MNPEEAAQWVKHGLERSQMSSQYLRGQLKYATMMGLWEKNPSNPKTQGSFHYMQLLSSGGRQRKRLDMHSKTNGNG